MRNSKNLLKSEISRSELPSAPASQGCCSFVLCFSYFTQNTPLFGALCVCYHQSLQIFHCCDSHDCSPPSLASLATQHHDACVTTLIDFNYNCFLYIFFLFSLSLLHQQRTSKACEWTRPTRRSRSLAERNRFTSQLTPPITTSRKCQTWTRRSSYRSEVPAKSESK